MANRRYEGNELVKKVARPWLVRWAKYPTEADVLSINRSTAKGIIKQYSEEDHVEELPRGGHSNIKIDGALKQS